MNQKDVIEKLIEEVHRVTERPMMYLGNVTVASALSFRGGIYCACSALGINLTTALLSRASNSRGWEFGPSGGVNSMREHGFAEDQIVQELLLNDIKMLELVAEGLAVRPCHE